MAITHLYFLNHFPDETFYIGLIPDGDRLRVVITNDKLRLFQAVAGGAMDLIVLTAQPEKLISINLAGSLACGLKDGHLSCEFKTDFGDGRFVELVMGVLRQPDGPVIEICLPLAALLATKPWLKN